MKKIVLVLALMIMAAPAWAESETVRMPGAPEVQKYERPVSSRFLGPGVFMNKGTLDYGAPEKNYIDAKESYVPNVKSFSYTEYACGGEARSSQINICLTKAERANRYDQPVNNKNTK